MERNAVVSVILYRIRRNFLVPEGMKGALNHSQTEAHFEQVSKEKIGLSVSRALQLSWLMLQRSIDIALLSVRLSHASIVTKRIKLSQGLHYQIALSS